MGSGELEELQRQIDDMIEKGWIKPSESEFGAPVLFVPKKGGKLRMCIDYRGLNRITRKKVYPLPRIDDLLDVAGVCKIFSKIDLKSGYHQIEVDPADQHKTAFKTRDGLYEFTVMPFGLTNAPTTFQSLVDKVFCNQINQFVVVYLDDILIFNKSMEEHMRHLEEVLQILKDAQLHLNLEKSEFGRDSVIYLGHRLSAAGLEPEATKVEVIHKWPQPANVHEWRSFLGFASYYRKFVPNFSIIARPLSKLTSKNVSYAWNEECTTAFQALKEALASHPVLRIADPKLTFVVTTDASLYGIGAVLQQDDGYDLRPLEFYNKRMPSHKVAASTYMRELYALREALDHLGRHFKVFSDHETLKWIQTQTNPSTTLTRWLHEIAVYDFELRHKKDFYNRVADALSRHREYMTCLVGSYDLRKNLKEELIEHTAKDPELSPVLEQIRADPSSQLDFHECKGLLFRRYGKHDRLCVPNHEPILTHFLDLAHGRSRHFGFEKTYGSLLQKFVWPGMKGMARKFVAECEVCQRIKPSRQKPYGLLHPLPIPDGPGESLSIDFTDMGKKSRNGYLQVMVIVDRFSKFLNLIPLPPHAPTDLVIKEFHKKYILQCGPPKTLMSDRDTRFISADWKDFTSQIYDIKLKMTSGRHPEANGLAEEINQIVIQLLRALIVLDQNSWDEELPIVQGFATSATVPRQQQCHVSNSAMSATVPRQQQCHVSSATVPPQQCPATMTGSVLGMPGQLTNESIVEYRQRFEAQLALIEAEEQRQVAAEAARLQAEAAATVEKQRLQAEAEVDTQAHRKEAQDLCQIWLSHLATIHGVDVADLHTKIPWADLTKLWKKRFIVDDAPTLAINCLFAMTQGNTATRDWLMEWQKIAATPDIELPFSHLRRKFYNWSCAALSLALGDHEQYATFAEIIDKAREIIKTNRAVAHEKSAWQPTYVEKGKFGPRSQHVAAVHTDNIVEDPAATQASCEGDQVAAVQPRSNNNSRGKGKAKTASPAGNGQPAPWVKFHLTEAEYKWRGRRSLDEHVEHLHTVLGRLRQAKYKANRDKCEFARQELGYLGHYVAPQGIRPLADKIEAIRVWPEPTNTTDVRSFMGLAGYYQRFITGYSRIAAPMTRLQSPKVPFVFDDDALSPINSLDDARKELLLFMMALKRWRHFLLGRRRFTWVTDNNPLTYYKTQDTVSSTIGRWMYFIDQFDFTPKHLPGLSNRTADALSRRPDLCAMTHHAFAFDEELQRHFVRGYESDPDFATLYAQLSSDHPPASHYRIIDGYLLLHSRGKDLLCVPRDRRLRTHLLGEYHDSQLAGHFGVNRTIARLRQRFRWPDLITDVTRYCGSCEVCRRSKPRNRNPYGELRPMPIPQEPGLSIAMDVTCPFPRDRLGHDSIITVVDRLSKYARFLPCKYYATAPELARLLHTSWICSHGVPEDIVSDRDTRFMSAFWTSLMQESGTKMKPSSARHPQTDGQTERAHQTAQIMLRTLICPDQKDWVDRLPDIEFAYNTSLHPVIGVTPFELHHGGRKGPYLR
ncbi:hypothetical protein CBR_g714 [Chara braunii]|uniref:Reverse transcriptase n=1 Tax=Chara braunii TaxID=69332 RepID=A0A388KBZ8_CHABU|nr:hypothetical protein CBR_g714 [Chara braunii]|eukprot:GBG67585.1 hypothetical protein CBR_g714 [Chara braunii]